jgi:hypothetical protein
MKVLDRREQIAHFSICTVGRSDRGINPVPGLTRPATDAIAPVTA